jgi:hypothetical protein
MFHLLHGFYGFYAGMCELNIRTRLTGQLCDSASEVRTSDAPSRTSASGFALSLPLPRSSHPFGRWVIPLVWFTCD